MAHNRIIKDEVTDNEFMQNAKDFKQSIVILRDKYLSTPEEDLKDLASPLETANAFKQRRILRYKQILDSLAWVK